MSVAPLHTAKVQLTKYLRPPSDSDRGVTVCGTADSAAGGSRSLAHHRATLELGHSVVRHPVSLKMTLLADQI